MTTKRRFELLNRLANAGFSFEEANALRRIQMTLHRWAEHECNGVIQRDDVTNKPRSYYVTQSGTVMAGGIIADRETGALKRLAAIMASHPDYVSYHQGDPRGCVLYIVPVSELRGQDIDGVYSRGIAVCD